MHPNDTGHLHHGHHGGSSNRRHGNQNINRFALRVRAPSQTAMRKDSYTSLVIQLRCLSSQLRNQTSKTRTGATLFNALLTSAEQHTTIVYHITVAFETSKNICCCCCFRTSLSPVRFSASCVFFSNSLDSSLFSASVSSLALDCCNHKHIQSITFAPAWLLSLLKT